MNFKTAFDVTSSPCCSGPPTQFSRAGRSVTPMAAYTIVPVAEVPDQAADVGMDPDHFEIRFLREKLGLENFAVTFERFGGGWRPARGHRHTVQEEVYFLISGRAQGRFNGEVVDLEPWTAVRVPPARPRGRFGQRETAMRSSSRSLRRKPDSTTSSSSRTTGSTKKF
jgi:mannose-6-phosphate isomerase-like protein (cupin superfamily)